MSTGGGEEAVLNIGNMAPLTWWFTGEEVFWGVIVREIGSIYVTTVWRFIVLGVARYYCTARKNKPPRAAQQP